MLPSHAQAKIAQSAPTETQIFTVYQYDANDEIRFRQAFGWVLQSTSSRSYTNNLSYDGVSFGTSIQAQGGQIRGTTHHKTDLVMVRRLDARGQQLRSLEQQWNDMPLPNPKVRMWLPAAAVFFGAGLIIRSIGALVPELEEIWLMMAVAFAAVGAPALILVIQSMKKARLVKQLEAKRAEARRAIVARARQISGAV